MRCELHAEALVEYREAALYYSARGRTLGEAFAELVEKAIVAIRHRPQARAADSEGVRRVLLRRFPYAIHYVIEQDMARDGEDFVVIYAVRHARRDSAYWRQRLPKR